VISDLAREEGFNALAGLKGNELRLLTVPAQELPEASSSAGCAQALIPPKP
jgi:hypothetical protein